MSTRKFVVKPTSFPEFYTTPEQSAILQNLGLSKDTADFTAVVTVADYVGNIINPIRYDIFPRYLNGSEVHGVPIWSTSRLISFFTTGSLIIEYNSAVSVTYRKKDIKLTYASTPKLLCSTLVSLIIELINTNLFPKQFVNEVSTPSLV